MELVVVPSGMGESRPRRPRHMFPCFHICFLFDQFKNALRIAVWIYLRVYPIHVYKEELLGQ